MDSCSAHLPHCVTIAVVGGFFTLFILLRLVHFFAFLLSLVTIVALLAFVTIFLFLLNVHLYGSTSPSPSSTSGSSSASGAIESASDSLHVYLSVHSIPIDALGGVEKLAAVRYANEQCTASPRLNGGLRNLCCSLCSKDNIVVGWKAVDIGKADMAARGPTQQVS
jgi:hypothetical protein